jgi:hypothetical protein
MAAALSDGERKLHKIAASIAALLPGAGNRSMPMK